MSTATLDHPEEPEPHRDQPGLARPAGDAGLQRRHPAGAGQATGQRRRRGRAVQPGLRHHHGLAPRRRRSARAGSSFTLPRRLDQRHLEHAPARSPQRARRTARWSTGSAVAATGNAADRRSVCAARRPAAAWTCNRAPSANGTQMIIWDCHTGANQQFTQNGAGAAGPRQVPRRPDQRRRRHAGTDLGLQRRHQPAVDAQRQRHHQQRPVPGLCLDVNTPPPPTASAVILWTCHGAANQRWARA